jgi:hypothetical protein
MHSNKQIIEAMKNNILTFAMFLVVSVLLVSCSSKPDRPESVLGERAVTQSTAPAVPAAGVNPNVKHYTCPNNCAGSGGDAAGTCPTCGTAYAHNAAYHNAPAGNTPSTTSPQISTSNPSVNSSVLGDNGGLNPTIATPPPSTPEPAQNAAGVWHYTCSNGCAGGGGSATACASCGSTLAHNSTYHN